MEKLNYLLLGLLVIFGVILNTGFSTGLISKVGNDLGTVGLEQRRSRSWVDLSSYMPDGIVQSVEVNVQPFKVEHFKDTPVIWVQIWSSLDPLSEENTVFRLKWQTPILLDKGGDRLYKVGIKLLDSIAISEADRIGWTSTSESVSVSASFDESWGSLLYTAKPTTLPQLGQNYSFDGLIHPKQFSVNVEVKENSERLDETNKLTSRVKNK